MKVAVLLSLLAVLASAKPIVSLPGFNGPLPTMESGYITVSGDATTGRNLFYWYVAADKSAGADAPVIFWLQGGPGCSSMMAIFTENGPFRVNPDGATLSENPESWNKQAHMVFIDSPANVGFSYDGSANAAGGRPSVTGDNQTSADLDTFVRGFLKEFPALEKKTVYISGESYGGHYVPQLARTLLSGNLLGRMPHVNLKGFLVGNPWTDDVIDGGAVPVFLWSHALVSRSTYLEVDRTCGDNWTAAIRASTTAATGASGEMSGVSASGKAFATSGGLFEASTADAARRTLRTGRDPRAILQALAVRTGDACASATMKMMTEMGTDVGDLDIYDPCFHVPGSALDCMNYTAVDTYLRAPATQAAINVRVAEVAAHALPWEACTSAISFTQAWPTTRVIYPELVASLDRVMVFSGDVTFNCAFTGSEAWIDLLVAEKELRVTRPWMAWNTASEVYGGPQTGGYTTIYSAIQNGATKGRFALATVRNAGHMVPQYQPERASAVLARFLAWNWETTPLA